jgi:hypothetical protein
MHFFDKKRADDQPSAKADANGIGNAAAAGGSIAAARDVILGYQPPAPSPAPPPRRAEELPSVPDIIFLRTRTITIDFSDGIPYEKQAGEGAMAVIACLRNDPVYGKNLAEPKHIAGGIVFRDANGEEIGNGVQRGCWLDTHHDMVDFELNKSHCIILVMAVGNKLAAPFKKREKTAYGEVTMLDGFDLSHNLSTIELRLISSRGVYLVPPLIFDFSIKDGSPLATKRQ